MTLTELPVDLSLWWDASLCLPEGFSPAGASSHPPSPLASKVTGPIQPRSEKGQGGHSVLTEVQSKKMSWVHASWAGSLASPLMSRDAEEF